MAQLVKVTTVDQLRGQSGKLVIVQGKDIVIFKRNEEMFAVNNVCAHQHFSMLHQGKVDGYEVTCPMHGWTYDMRTGKSTTGQGQVSTYTVQVVGEDVFIEIP